MHESSLASLLITFKKTSEIKHCPKDFTYSFSTNTHANELKN